MIANPGIPLSGVGAVSKSAVFDLAGEHARQWILTDVDENPIEEQLTKARESLVAAGLGYPVVGKPNIGCRGAGVKLLTNEQELQAYLRGFPTGGCIQFQKLSQWDAKAGVFYVRNPEQANCCISTRLDIGHVGMTLFRGESPINWYFQQVIVAVLWSGLLRN